MNKEQLELLQAIELMINEKLKGLKFNYTLEGTITEVMNTTTYKVRIFDTEEILKSIDNTTYQVGDVVKIIVYNGNYSDKAIWHKRV